MHKEWQVIMYKNDVGECPVADFLDTLTDKDRNKIATWIEILKQQGANSKRPQSDYLRDGIHELRIKLSAGNTRTLYFFCYETNIVLTHTFIKKTDKVPESEINRALIYKQDFLNRFNKTK